MQVWGLADKLTVGSVAISAVLGGTVEVLGGGKFANGAISGAYIMLLNHMTTGGENDQDQNNKSKKLSFQTSEDLDRLLDIMIEIEKGLEGHISDFLDEQLLDFPRLGSKSLKKEIQFRNAEREIIFEVVIINPKLSAPDFGSFYGVTYIDFASYGRPPQGRFEIRGTYLKNGNLKFLDMNKNLTSISKWMLFLCSFLLLAHCRDNEKLLKSNQLLEVALDYYGIDETLDWMAANELTSMSLELMERGTALDEVYLSFEKIIADTVFSLYFNMLFNENDSVFLPRHFYQRFYSDGFQHIILFGKKKDSLFHYKAELFQSLQKVFISGKYYYQYHFNELTAGQRSFFECHKDSLSKVKGHNLPKLPDK